MPTYKELAQACKLLAEQDKIIAYYCDDFVPKSELEYFELLMKIDIKIGDENNG